MKKKELNELKTKGLPELLKKLREFEREKVQMQIELNMGKVKNFHLLRQKKQNIAKVKTIISMKNLVAATTSETAKMESKDASG